MKMKRRLYFPVLIALLAALVFGAIPLGQPSPAYASPDTTTVVPNAQHANDTTGETDLSGITGDDSTTEDPDKLSKVSTIDNVYTVDQGEVMYLDTFDASSIPDGATITAAVLHLQYGAETGYTGTSPVRYDNGAGLTTTGITPTDISGWSADLTFDLYSVGVDTKSAIQNVDIEFTNNDSSPPNDAIHFDYVWIVVDYTLPPPTVTGITPSKGTTADAALAITDLAGTGFVTGASVELNFNGADSIAATGVNVVSATQITCSFDLSGVSTNLGAAWDVKVTNPDTQSGTGNDLFTIYLPDPTVSSITPATGENTGSVSITDLAGTNFVNGATSVKLAKGGESDINGTSVVVVSTIKITCDFDLTGAATGAWDVVVTVTNAESPGTLAAGFTVTSLTPNISNTPSSWAIGTVSASTNYWSSGSAPTFPLDDAECHFTVTNNSGFATNISITGSNFTGGDGWTLVASSPGSGQVVLKAGKSGDALEENMVTLTTSAQSFILGLADSGTKKWELKLETGTFSDGGPKSGTVTLTATAA